MVLPHSFPDETCRCRPGKRANAWPRAREPLPACWDLRKVCVSNPGSARWGRRGCWEGCRQGHAAQKLGRGGPRHQGSRSWDAPPHGPSLCQKCSSCWGGVFQARAREQGGMWALLGDVIVGRERRQNLEHLGADEHPWGSLSPTSLLNSSIQKGQSLPIKLGSHQPTRQPARTQGLQAEDRNLVQPRRGPDLRRQQFKMGQALWNPHVLRGKSMGPATVLLRRRPIGRVGNRGPQMRNEQRSVPSKDKGKCGPALWGWPLVAHM